MQIKKELRKTIRFARKNIENKDFLDKKIAQSLLTFDVYKRAKTILCYVSLDDEVSTDFIIDRALNSDKQVAVPFCTDSNGHMDFYLINSLSDLNLGSFNVREPDIRKCKKLIDFNESICIVPGMCFDEKGYRLGYGKGYYDRFLEKYSFNSIGLCYNSLIQKQIPADAYDKPVDFIITDSRLIICNNGGKNG